MIPEPIWEVFWEACIARGGPFALCFVCPWVRKIVLLMPGTPKVHQKRQNMRKKNSPDLQPFAAFYSFLAQRTLLVLASVDPKSTKEVVLDVVNGGGNGMGVGEALTLASKVV